MSKTMSRRCPVCMGRTRMAKFDYLCAQENGPCGILAMRTSRKGTNITDFKPTRINKSRGFESMTNYVNWPWVRYYAAGHTITPAEYFVRGGVYEPKGDTNE